MMNQLKYSLMSLLAVLASAAGHFAQAADVRVSMSTQETYVGLPVRLQVEVRDAAKVTPPVLPAIEGVKIDSVGRPGRSTRITSINGRMTTTTSSTYSFDLTPQRAGSFEVPAFTVHADGADLSTHPLSFVASNSNTDDLMFVEIAGKQKQIYVGQSLDVTLRIWIRPYHDREHKITLSESDVWQLISDRTSWGMFAERMSELAAKDQRPGGKEVLRKDSNGAEHSYYLYEVDATIYPKHLGKIDASEVKIVVEYPTALGKARDPFAGFFDDMPFPGGRPSALDEDSFSPFGRRLTIESVRPIVAEAHADAIEILPIPIADRPTDYRGAVGKYVIATEANPVHVKAGDPIDLMIGVSGTGPMDLVQAPPLAEVSSLTADFKVPTEPLAGFVKGDRKVFSTSIRPRHAGIARIPSIPFSYFDPAIGKFVTVHSEPVSIQVDAADILALDAVVGKERGTASGKAATKSTQQAAIDAALPIYTSADVLRSEATFSLWQPSFVILLLAPPLAVFVIAAVRMRVLVSLLAGRFGSPLRRLENAVQAATQPSEIAAALQNFVEKCTGAGRLSKGRGELLGELRLAGAGELAVRCERFFEATDDVASPVHSVGQTMDGLKREAIQIAECIAARSDARHLKSCPSRICKKPSSKSSRRPAAARVAVWLVVAICALALASPPIFAADEVPGNAKSPIVAAESNLPPSAASSSARSLTLSAEQQQVLFDEANACYRQGDSARTTEVAAAKQNFADAAEKYETLVSSGVMNNRLFVNLANAYLESGRPGKAVANYRRALKIAPSNAVARNGLVEAERSLKPKSSDVRASDKLSNLGTTKLAAAVGDYLGMTSLRTLAIVAWFVFWGALAVRLLGARFAWKSIAATSLAVIVVTCMMLLTAWKESTQPAAVVTVANAKLNQSAASAPTPLSNAVLQEGQTVKPLIERGDWIQVRTDTGQIGWLPRQVVDVI